MKSCKHWTRRRDCLGAINSLLPSRNSQLQQWIIQIHQGHVSSSNLDNIIVIMPSQWNYIRIIPLLLLCFKGECQWVISETWDWLSAGLPTISESIAPFKTKLQNEIGWENCPNSRQLYIISSYPTKTFKKNHPILLKSHSIVPSYVDRHGCQGGVFYGLFISLSIAVLYQGKASGNSASMTYMHTCTCM